MRYGAQLRIEPALAERWEIVEPARWRRDVQRGSVPCVAGVHLRVGRGEPGDLRRVALRRRRRPAALGEGGMRAAARARLSTAVSGWEGRVGVGGHVRGASA